MRVTGPSDTGFHPHDILKTLKNDRDRLWALISRDLRIVAVTALCAGASGASPLLREVFLRWLA
ncbi:MAG: hypothetical protein HYZ17_04050 [Betaproteobacteria bacterium]|nr:hypothetical protein [Betaproteobacteria bacterium]